MGAASAATAVLGSDDGLAGNDTAHLSASGCRARRGNVWFRRVNGRAEKHATPACNVPSGFLLRTDDGGSRPPKVAPHKSSRCSRAQFLGVTGSTRLVAATSARP